MINPIIETEIKHIKDGFDVIASAVGKAKIGAINTVWENPDVQWALCTLLDNSIVFHVKEKSLEKDVPFDFYSPYDSLRRMCDDLCSKSALKDEDLGRIQVTLDWIEDDDLREYAKKSIRRLVVT